LPLSPTPSGACERLDDGACFRHETLFYAGDDEFLAGTVPFIEDGLDASEPILVAVGGERIALIKDALDGAGEHVGFLDMHALGRNPARIIPEWQRFLGMAAPDGAPVRGIGEPIWPGRSRAELIECERHESLLNVAFDGGQGWRLLCPYDLERLDDDILAGARRNHPVIAGACGRHASSSYVSANAGPGPFDGELPAPRGVVERTCVASAEGLAPMREWLACWAADAQMSAGNVQQLVLAVNELASNSVCYGGGAGTVRAWREDSKIVCEVGDDGHIDEPLAGRMQPTPVQSTGRGLWLVNQLCDLVQIRSSREGTSVRVHMGVG
jgi:anti-sigma regulatory factor (Ser/Thr protein kinase)